MKSLRDEIRTDVRDIEDGFNFICRHSGRFHPTQQRWISSRHRRDFIFCYFKRLCLSLNIKLNKFKIYMCFSLLQFRTLSTEKVRRASAGLFQLNPSWRTGEIHLRWMKSLRDEIRLRRVNRMNLISP